MKKTEVVGALFLLIGLIGFIISLVIFTFTIDTLLGFMVGFIGLFIIGNILVEGSR